VNGASGVIENALFLAAAEAGLDAVWLIGGAQAIAALTFGAVLDDGEIEPVDKLFGPGNAFVAEAKKQAAKLGGEAAKALDVSHPTVARRVHALEQQIGARLFDRLPDRFVPTSVGEELRTKFGDEVMTEIEKLGYSFNAGLDS